MTNVIKNLTQEESEKILAEIFSLSHMFGNHYGDDPHYKNSALKDGKSVWLHGPEKNNGDFMFSNKASFIISFIREIAKSLNATNFGRTYIYDLGPGLEIFKHTDPQEYFHKTTRYHIYLKIPKNVNIVHSGPMPTDNTVIFFDPLLEHSYKNESNESLLFIVFDLYN
jgi:hypothetical protein